LTVAIEILGAANGFFANAGTLLAGMAELLTALGAGIAFVIRGRRQARQVRIRTEALAATAAREAQNALEKRLEKQHVDQIQQYKDQIADLQRRQAEQVDDLQRSYELQIAAYKVQIKDLNDDRKTLLDRLLTESRGKTGNST
jgi:uncharacterized protein HemX